MTGSKEEGDALLASLRFAYRLVEESEWADAQGKGFYPGTELDKKDNFMHLSLPSEVLTTARLYYSSHPGPLLVLCVDLSLVPGVQMRADWVDSRKAFFPHILNIGGDQGYTFPVISVTKVHTLTKSPTGEWEGFVV